MWCSRCGRGVTPRRRFHVFDGMGEIIDDLVRLLKEMNINHDIYICLPTIMARSGFVSWKHFQMQ
jgi:hypothetical protein